MSNRNRKLPGIDRRTLLMGMGATALGGVVGCARWGVPTQVSSALAAVGPQPELAQPPEEVSRDGLLRVQMEAKYGRYDLAGRPVMLRSFDGGPLGRTLRVQAGDQLRLSLHNRLPYDPLEALCTAVPEIGDNTPRGFNVTNMHVHGLHVSPDSPADNVLLLIRHDERQHYVYDIPEDQPPGTYFYHAHFHGSVALQVASGMAGALIVEGKVDRIPEIRAAREQVIVFQTQRFDDDGVCEDYRVLAQPGPVYVNGQLRPLIRMQPGEVQRWRLVNASHQLNMELALGDHQFTALCYDGNPLYETKRVDQVPMVPGNRADLLVKAGKPGRYPLVVGKDADGRDLIAADIEVQGEVREMPLFSGRLPGREMLKDIDEKDVTFGRRLEFGLAGNISGNKYTINGLPFSCEDPWLIPLGAVEEWEVYNHTAESHPFHIHVNPFQMLSGGNVPPGTWLDTVNLAPFQRIRFRTRFENYTGTFVFHCHNLTHEDLGMMQAVRVVPPGSLA
ncbi:multicopper oxidase family protein [Marinobacterium arenosum]|uniref:multicopper oxidase family protein n=1 Tax=Marinobacterium arenosum TaxID=2862496 RepID=UPI001C98970B|nr:multicopper oxidase family protein [Marinobacterium arenosum]MBY4677039.1 multicopper oxidase family protein [Marinobacterium arenosum]